MRRKWTAAAVVLTLAPALGLGLPATPAAADNDPTWLGCYAQPQPTTGELTSYDPGTFVRDEWLGQLYGTIRPCRPPVATDVFAVAFYDAHGSATATAVPYPWTLGFVAPANVPPKTEAICLIDNLTSRLDCITIGWVGQPEGPPRPQNTGHLSVDSPLVAATPTVRMGGRWVEPGCPTCVD
jgi:hypothetical protein